ncbi:MAG TPA: aminotransferase class III-fold pyridoxal phosphate-dependent enzyme, partial [Chlamydiales bacterium]|nr:aminotransferase class III-fold pyridoxal phosphate-dependent enzyme [Chlamydiales bacterium]
MLNRTKSEKQYRKLKELIPGGVNSPVRAFRGLNMTPLIASHAFQDLLVDADGRQYIDYCLSWGALIHGHAHPQIVDAVIERVKKGSSFGCTTEIEGRLAEKIIDAMPSIERIRFVSSGTEATMSALRLARGYTGKEIFIKFNGCYHGHSDQLLVQAGSGVLGFNGTSTSAGIPKEFLQWTACLPFN